MSTDDKIEMADHGEADAATAEGHVVVACLSRLLNLIEATDETAAKRIEEVDGRYCVVSEETGRSFGCYDTKAEAAERLAQVERFAESDKADDGDELDDVFRRYYETVNMGAAELEAWSETECSTLASLDRSPIERNLRLLGRKKEDWTDGDIRDAKRTISFVARMREVGVGEPVKAGCPSRRDISLRNWAFDPDKARKRAEQDPAVKRDLAVIEETMARDIRVVFDRGEQLAKADTEEHFVLGIVLEPNDGEDGAPLDPDAQQDIYSAEWIREQAHTFMASYRRIGVQHQIVLPTDAVQILESYIAPSDFDFELPGGGTYKVRKGTWLLGIRVIDDALWKAIKDGEFTGFSIEGFATRSPQKVRKAGRNLYYRNSSRPAQCFYHADMDGVMSAAIVVKALSPEPVECHEINHGRPFPWELLGLASRVFMVDFGLQPFDDMVCLADTCDALGVEFVWIDHHATAISNYEASPVDGIMGIQRSGTKATDDGEPLTPAESEAGCELAWKFFYPDEPMPPIVSLIGRWDVWDHADKMVRPVIYGMESFEDTSPAGTTIQDALGWSSDDIKKNVLPRGKHVLGYLIKGYETALESRSFEVEMDGLDCIAMNTGEQGSIQFESVIGLYDAALAFKWVPATGWSVGLYALRDGVDVGSVCKARGGGGHRGAGGFQTPELPFPLPLVRSA